MFKESLKFETSFHKGYKLSHHAAYHRDYYGLVTAGPVAVEDLHLPATLLNEWRRAIGLEIDLVREQRKSEFTEQLRQTDAERLGIYSGILSIVKGNRFFAPRRGAAMALYPITSAHNRARRFTCGERTSLMSSLLNDLYKPASLPHAQALGLVPIMEALREANDRYTHLQNERTKATAQLALPNARLVRHRADECLKQVQGFVNVFYLIASSAELEEQFRTLAGLINALTKRLRSSHLQGQSRRKNAAAH